MQNCSLPHHLIHMRAHIYNKRVMLARALVIRTANRRRCNCSELSSTNAPELSDAAAAAAAVALARLQSLNAFAWACIICTHYIYNVQENVCTNEPGLSLAAPTVEYIRTTVQPSGPPMLARGS